MKGLICSSLFGCLGVIVPPLLELRIYIRNRKIDPRGLAACGPLDRLQMPNDPAAIKLADDHGVVAMHHAAEARLLHEIPQRCRVP